MDINGGQLTQTNGNPAWPAAQSTGPLTAGNIPHGDGVSALANVGEWTGGTGNAGYVAMTQFSAPISQAASSASGGVTTQIVIPAQSMILSMILYVTTSFTSGTTTAGISDTTGTLYTSTTGVAGGTLGAITITGPATKPETKTWENVGNTDVQLVFTAGNTGNGQCVLAVTYVQGCNSAIST